MEAKLNIAMSSSTLSDKALQVLAAVEWQLGRVSNARAYLGKLSSPAPGLVLQGWIEMQEQQGFGALAMASGTTGQGAGGTPFDTVLASNARDVQALMGRCHNLRYIRRLPAFALDVLAQLLGLYPNFVPAYIERMWLHVELGAWDAALETVRRVRILVPESVDAATVECMYTLVRTSIIPNMSQTAAQLDNLLQCLKAQEPSNAALYGRIGRGLASLCFRHEPLLARCSALLERAIELDNAHTADWAVALGRVRLAQGFLPAAKEAFQRAMAIDASNVSALQGLLSAYLQSGDFANAEEQLGVFYTLQLHGGCRGVSLSFLKRNQLTPPNSFACRLNNQRTRKLCTRLRWWRRGTREMPQARLTCYNAPWPCTWTPRSWQRACTESRLNSIVSSTILFCSTCIRRRGRPTSLGPLTNVLCWPQTLAVS